MAGNVLKKEKASPVRARRRSRRYERTISFNKSAPDPCRRFRLLNATDNQSFEYLPDRKRLQLLAAFKRRDEPPWPMAPSCPGFLAVLGIAVARGKFLTFESMGPSMGAVADFVAATLRSLPIASINRERSLAERSSISVSIFPFATRSSSKAIDLTFSISEPFYSCLTAHLGNEAAQSCNVDMDALCVADAIAASSCGYCPASAAKAAGASRQQVPMRRPGDRRRGRCRRWGEANGGRDFIALSPSNDLGGGLEIDGVRSAATECAPYGIEIWVRPVRLRCALSCLRR